MGTRRSQTIVFCALALLVLVAVLALAACGGSDTTTSTNGGAAWSQQNSGANGILREVAFPDAKHGWAVGYEGGPAGPSIILATGDGGATWGQQESGTKAHPCAVAFPDAKHGWVVGGFHDEATKSEIDGVILATTNGGASWTTQESLHGPGLEDVAFPDAKHGWAVGSRSTIVATTDGGTAWRAQEANTEFPELFKGVAFVDARHGWAVGSDGFILATTNGGATWKSQRLGSGLWWSAVTFSDAKHGWTVGMDFAHDPMRDTNLATTDGGATWSEQYSSSEATKRELHDVAFLDTKHGWVVGNPGLILVTTSGGAAR
jgi:photosystem II stability/assembly factor-like uncharacterized protein